MADKTKKVKEKPIVAKSIAKPSALDEIWRNYDAVFKDAVTMFKDKSLGFFGLPDDVTITEPLKTETTEIIVKSEFADMTFRMSNRKGMHFESEVALSLEDLFRFCHYHIDLIRMYKCDFTTVIFVKEPHSIASLDYEMLQFKPIIINCGDYNADEILAKMKKQLVAGEALNELEAIYLPLFKSATYSPAELLTESIRLVNAAEMDDEQKLKISALMLVLSKKIVSAEKLESIWIELKMMRIKIFEYVFQKTLEKNMEQIKRIKSLYITDKLTPAEIAEKEQITDETVNEILELLGLIYRKETPNE